MIEIHSNLVWLFIFEILVVSLAYIIVHLFRRKKKELCERSYYLYLRMIIISSEADRYWLYSRRASPTASYTHFLSVAYAQLCTSPSLLFCSVLLFLETNKEPLCTFSLHLESFCLCCLT